MHRLPELTYPYDALEPHISGTIMELHHSGHHQAYVDKLNAALADAPEVAHMPIDELLGKLSDLPESMQIAVRNNGGGHFNHSNFWQWMSPDGGGQPTGKLGAAIDEKYGDFQSFIDKFEAAAMGVFGSGWVWLTPNLEITTSPNQDSPLMNSEAAPILGLDVWEHAYYIDYTYKRADYVKAWWNIVNWNEVARRFDAN